MPPTLWRRVLHALFGREREERRIGLTAGAVLLTVVLGAGSVFLVQAVKSTQDHLEQELGDTLLDRATIVGQTLAHASETGASVATDRPHLKVVLGRIMNDKATPADLADLSRILDNIAKRANVRAIELRDGHGVVLGQRGAFLSKPKYLAPVRLPYPAKLLWNQVYVLEQQVSIVEAGRKVGEARVQLSLVDIDKLFTAQQSLGETGEFVICASLSERDMTCYPSRWSPDSKNQKESESRYIEGRPLPMHFALEGKTGTVTSVDYRRKSVVAAFGTVGDLGLGMVMKRDRAELLDLSRRSFTRALPLLLLLSAAGVWLLRWRLAPLVHDVVESRAELKALVDSAPDAIVSLDEHGRIRSFNPAAVGLFGYLPEEVVGEHITQLVPEVGDVSAGLPANGLASGQHKDGRSFPIEVSIAQALSGTGAGHVATLRDITSRTQAEEALKKRYDEIHALNCQLKDAQDQLLQSEKMASVGQLAAGVAHEINNPIGYVHSNLGTLESYSNDLLQLVHAYELEETAITDAAALERLRAAKKGADLEFLRSDMSTLMGETREGVTRVKNIVQGLKDFSRIDATDEMYWEDLRMGLDSTLNIIWNELKYKAEVRKEYADIPEIECLPSELNQVFLNLLVNAGHALEDKGVITIRTGQEGEQVWVEIEDNGKGIAPEHLTRIFDPFFTTKPVGQGTGLGLSVSYSIVQKHGGNIEVKSEPGQGTIFRIWLPINQNGPKDTGAADAQAVDESPAIVSPA